MQNSKQPYLAPQIAKVEICLQDILTVSTGNNKLEPDFGEDD